MGSSAGSTILNVYSEIWANLRYGHPLKPRCPDKRGSTVVCIGSKKSPPISRVNKHQYNNNKRVRRESRLLEIAIGEGIRSAQLGKSSLRRNRAWYIHPLEFRCAESGERLQEERQPGAPCCVSSDDVWRVAVNGYETTRS